MSTEKHHTRQRSWMTVRECAVCNSKAIGINFGAPTCAPCKAFFRRNARRKEVLKLSCQIVNSDSTDSEIQHQHENNKNSFMCPQIRHCTSCRLRRCFDIGMKEELVRTDEEKQRYKQLIETNRRRRREVLNVKQNNHLQISPISVCTDELLEESDWTLLSNIVRAYDNYCLKSFTENRQFMFENQRKISDQIVSKINHHESTRINIIRSLLSFITAVPTTKSLSDSDQVYLRKHNIRSLILLNLHEIEQTCFSESWQQLADATAAKYVYGEELFSECIQMKRKAESILIADPAITRLWLLILYFSSPLACYYDRSLSKISHEDHLDANQMQYSFIILLWKYLSHRHGYFDAVRIFSNFIRIYLQMQRITQAINHQIRTRDELAGIDQQLNRAIVLENDI